MSEKPSPLSPSPDKGEGWRKSGGRGGIGGGKWSGRNGEG